MLKNLAPITLSLVTASSTFVCQSIKELIDFKKYSHLNQLLRVTSYVTWFKSLIVVGGKLSHVILPYHEMK